MSKSRMMGAGLAGSTSYNSNPNINTGGGNKKQGLGPTTNRPSFALNFIRQRAGGENRTAFFCMNQLGGIGRHRSQFASNADGIDCPPEIDYIYVSQYEYNIIDRLSNGGLTPRLIVNNPTTDPYPYISEDYAGFFGNSVELQYATEIFFGKFITMHNIPGYAIPGY